MGPMPTMVMNMLPMPMDMPTMDTTDTLMPTTMARGLLMLMLMLTTAMDMLLMPMDMPTTATTDTPMPTTMARGLLMLRLMPMVTTDIPMPATDTIINLLTIC